MASVQFFGIDSVTKAYLNRNCPNWAIFQGRQFLFKYEGGDAEESAQLLGEILENLKVSAAVYTLQFYEDAARIKANTPHDGSFNFRLVDEEARQARAQVYETSGPRVLRKLEEIDARLTAMESGQDDDDDEGFTLSGIAKNLLQNPEQIGPLIGAIRSIFMPMSQPAKIAGAPGADRLQAVINELAAVDPQITEHLEKLAAIAKNQPGMFQSLIKMLEGF